MKRILIAIHLDSFFTGLIGVARLLKDTGRYEPVMYFAQRYQTVQRDIEICRKEGIECLGAAQQLLKLKPTDGKLPVLNKVFNFILERLSNDSQNKIKTYVNNNFLFQLWKLSRTLQLARKMIRKEHLSLLILGGDVTHYDTSVYIKAAHLENIRAVIIAGWMINQDENAEAFKYDVNYHLIGWFNRLIGLLYPDWVYNYRGLRMLRLPGGHVFARELLGLVPPLPWTLHSGYADAITVESTAMLDACIREGLPLKQLVFTGSIIHDTLARVTKERLQRRESLYKDLALPSNRPLLLCTLPPNEFYRIGGLPQCDFHNYDELIKFWVPALAAVEGWNVIITLHPSVQYETMHYIEQWGVKIARVHTAEIVPLCDALVSYGSTVTQWATVCGKPVINYDVFRYRPVDFAGIEGLLAMEEQDEFLAVLHRLTSDRKWYEEVAARQAACAGYWGQPDGLVGARMIELFDRLI